ncbi:hypothetical protein GCM10025858_27300 [Alicyclobacillus sacchari]|uniref:putative inorganic carbon transporter subunit DabA n=1 Tax=Alicyclobacillus sacchari TaxID=392010 RepID=UPI0023E97933|nr:putative inorganic carbon transporter subunit DabA [Alicyclobacillus sacchari]GMA58227.1 hypothetical protein GCM10025858_27300 [Alicyclobacillus sacchari]
MRQSHAVQRNTASPLGNIQLQDRVLAWVTQAMDVVVPQWPLPVFVARHPWMHLEHMSFADALSLLEDMQDVQLRPALSVIQSAVERGDIALPIFEQRLRAWVDEHVPPSLTARLEPVLRALIWEEESESAVPEYVWAFANEVVAAGEAPLSSRKVVVHSNESGHVRSRLAQQTIKWCKLFLDAGQAGWRLPGTQDGLYKAWRHLILRDPALTRTERRRLADWPTDSVEAIAFAIKMLALEEHEAVAYLRAHLAALPGWVGMLSWRGREEGCEIELVVDYLALRVSLEWALYGLTGADAAITVNDDVTKDVALSLAALHRYGGMTRSSWRNVPISTRTELLAIVDRFRRVERWQLWLEAWEDTQAQRMAAACKVPTDELTEAVAAQLLFCIDVRSEPFRRNLEASGPFATYGCAGFFNLPIKTRHLDCSYAHPSCPAIVTPTVELRESLVEPSLIAYRRRQSGIRLIGDVFKR